MALLLTMITPLNAHEGHTHPLGGVPLWQIVIVVGLAIGIYIGIKFWRKQRAKRQGE